MRIDSKLARERHWKVLTHLSLLVLVLSLLGAATGAAAPVYAATQGNAAAQVNAAVPNDSLIDLSKLDSSLAFDLRYASANNFTGKKLYTSGIACLQESTAWKLAKANEEVMKKGYRIKVWDAYRPYSVQKAMWKVMPDPGFVADPNKGGSKHNKGAAADVTLVDLKGKEVEMPSSFDDFTIKASRRNPHMTAAAARNLKILTDAMEKSGFKSISTEWWHYDDTDSSKYPILDVKPEAVAARPLPVESLKRLGNSSQVILVTNSTQKSSRAVLQRFEKVSGKWLKVSPDISAFIGKNGFKKVKASPLTEADKVNYKYEGDGSTPMGIFTITMLFGWGSNPGFQLPYSKTGDSDYWVSSKTKETYNVMIRRNGGPDKSWTSYERLKIPQYKYAALIDYNTVPNKIIGNGSAIFLHISDSKGYTSGCTSVAEADLVKILKWLEADKKPLIIQAVQSELTNIAG